MKITSSIRYCLLAACCLSTVLICNAHVQEASVRVSAKNVEGYNLTYNRSYNGVWLRHSTPINLDSDSTFILKIPTEGVERMMILANDPNRKLPGASKSFYIMPGVTEVTVDPFASEKISVAAPSGNSLDSNAADIDGKIYNIWFALATGGQDQLGLYSDTIPASVSAKLECFVDSLLKPYTEASPEVAEAARRYVGLCALMVYQACYDEAKFNDKHKPWEKNLAQIRDEIDMNNPANARSPFYGDIMRNFFFQDFNPEGISPDSLLRIRSEHILSTLSGKAAEAVLGQLLYNDGESGTFSPSAVALTERFKFLFPDSGLIPFLDKKVEENLAFNHPKSSEEIVFLDNSSLKSLDQLFTSYKGKPMLIDIWATWCGPCRKSFEHVRPLQEYADENGIQLLYISVDEQDGIEDKWKNMVNYYNLKGHHVIINPDIKQEVYSTFGNSDNILSIPCYAIIDRNGNLTVLGSDLAESTDFTELRKILDTIIRTVL